MSDKIIDIKAILLESIKKTLNVDNRNFEQAFQDMWMVLDPEPSRRVVIRAIKEIVEATIDLCAKKAKLTEFAQEFMQEGASEAIDKDSILNVKKLISYE